MNKLDILPPEGRPQEFCPTVARVDGGNPENGSAGKEVILIGGNGRALDMQSAEDAAMLVRENSFRRNRYVLAATEPVVEVVDGSTVLEALGDSVLDEHTYRSLAGPLLSITLKTDAGSPHELLAIRVARERVRDALMSETIAA